MRKGGGWKERGEEESGEGEGRGRGEREGVCIVPGAHPSTKMEINTEFVNTHLSQFAWGNL